MKIVSVTQPPELPFYGSYWERSKDPFHIDAIKPAVVQSGKEIANEQDFDHGPQKEGWMCIDWIENPVGFVADGVDAGNPCEYTIKEGPHKRPCAYPASPAAKEV